jgi:hypothetical protein
MLFTQAITTLEEEDEEHQPYKDRQRIQLGQWLQGHVGMIIRYL